MLLLVKVCAIGVPPLALPPVIPPPSTTVHAKVVPDVLLVNAMLGAVPLQIETADGVAVIDGAGFTVIDAVAVAVQVFSVPVMV